MPEKSVPPPLWLLVIVSSVMGLIAQLGTSLAMDMARDKVKLYGFLLLSLVFSGATTTLLVQLTAIDDLACTAIGTLAGAAPALWTLRAGVQLIAKKYELNIQDISSSAPAQPPTAAPVKKDGDA